MMATTNKYAKGPLKEWKTGYYNNMPTQQGWWYNQYSSQLEQGKANKDYYGWYENLSKQYGLKKHTASEDTLRQLSLKAASGDKNASEYLKWTQAKPVTGSSLWKNYDTKKGFINSTLEGLYMKDNPYASYTKGKEVAKYNNYVKKIQNKEAMSDKELADYMNLVNKWNMEDINNPFVQQQKQLEKDKQSALDAQDVALNQGMATLDSNAFKQFLGIQQEMSNRGMTDSGIASDAYMRATMANNQDYQKAYADSAQTKSDINTSFNQAIADSKVGKLQYESEQANAQMEQSIELQKLQNDQDKWLTKETGNVYVNGKQIKVNGKPITTIAWQKLSETQRHNLVTEAMTYQKNAWNYELGRDANAIKREGIAVDLQIALGNMELDKARLDYNYAKLESSNAIAQDKLALARDNAQTSADKAKIDALGRELNSLTSQITAYQRAGKKPPSNLVDAYNNVVSELRGVAGNF